jgi:hypothetical protein
MEAKPWHVLTKPTLSKEEAQKRYDICKECPHLIAMTKQCRHCLCVMPLKVKVPNAFCPINKW